MAKIVQEAKINVSATFTVDEGELRALDALSGYDNSEVVRVFKTHMGKAYLEGHEKDLERFLNSVRTVVKSALNKVDNARRNLG